MTIQRFFLSCFLLLSLISFAYAQTANTQTRPHIAFVQTASTGQLVAVSGQSNEYTLTLYHVSPYITYYFHRPNRATGLALVKNFINTWTFGPDNFAQDNPNAVIYAGQINGQPNQANVSYVVQIANPAFSLMTDQMTYKVVPLGKNGFILNQIDLADIVVVIN